MNPQYKTYRVQCPACKTEQSYVQQLILKPAKPYRARVEVEVIKCAKCNTTFNLEPENITTIYKPVPWLKRN